MAFIGMRYPVASPISAETAGAEPTYGTGLVVGHAITGNLTINRNDNPLYGDDVIVENDNGITSMSLELGVDDLEPSVREALLGLKKKASTGTSVPDVYYDTAASAPYVGFGYIRVRRKDGETKFQAIWLHKVSFSETAENSQTKGESIEWQTPTLTGRVMGLSLTDSAVGDISFRKYAFFDTETAAKTWLNTQAGIT